MSAGRIFLQGWRVGQRDFSVFWTWKTWLGGWMVRIISNVLIWVLLGKLLGSPSKLNYLLIGNAATAGVGTFAVVVPCWERFNGTFPLLVAAPGNMAPAILGRMAVWAVGWVVTALLTFGLLAWLFHFALSWTALLVVPVFILLFSLSTYFFSAFLGAFVIAAPRLRLILAWVLLTILSTFCGINVPVSFWPKWVQLIAYILPVTHGLEAVRITFSQGLTPHVIIDAILELTIGLGWLVLALVALSRSADKARADGSIELV